MERREIWLVILGLLMGLVIVLLLLTPRINLTTPIRSSDTAWPEITIQFNRPIDEDSLSDRLVFVPTIAGHTRVEGDKVLFRPAEALHYGQTYTVTIQPGVKGTNSLPLISGTEYSFVISEPRLAYLQELDGSSNLWVRERTGDLVPLTRSQDIIWDFEANPDGHGILYSVSDDTGGDLWLLKTSGETETILDCQRDVCRSATWQPSGTLIAYERQLDDTSNDNIEVWLLDTFSNQTWPAQNKSFLDSSGFESSTSHYPRWSTDGRYLSFFKPDAKVIVVLDMEGGPVELMPANLEIMGNWSPKDYRLAFSELVFGHQVELGEDNANIISNTQLSLYKHTVLADFDLDQTTDISQGLEAYDGQPAWHPAGDLLATSRTVTGGGRQIWLLPLDGSVAYSITDDPFFNHTAVQWSPDGRKLAYMRTGLADGSVPEIWLLDIENGQKEMVVKGGFTPKWLP